LKEYEEALLIYRERAVENPKTYLPDVAMTLNNLANFHKDQNDFSRAFKEYEEALLIYRERAAENPRTYLSGVANVLNNLANLHKVFYPQLS
jgi:tetratricopeptide (TPR) repeat protein